MVEVVLAGVVNGGGAIARSGLGKDPIDVTLDRVVAEYEPLGDLEVGRAGGKKGQYLGLSRGQVIG